MTTVLTKKRLFRYGGLLLLLFFLSFSGLCLFIDRFGQVDRARPAQAIIILGARVEPTHQPGDSLRSRTLHAVELYRNHLAPKIICTGGLGLYPPTEAEAAATFAKAHGVPAGDLLMETESTDTWENAKNAAAICRQHGWTRVLVVSDPYHLWRAKNDFTRVGLTAFTSPALTCERNRKAPMRILWTIREGLAVIRDALSLWR